jgi:prepilin-type N-terminal cleavage/methylation domain-containing protein
MNHKNLRNQGFTLIELLIVIAVMAILMAVVFVALNPLGRFADSRNARRWSDVNNILNAIKISQVDNGGIYIDAIATSTTANDTFYQIAIGETCPGTGGQPACGTVTLNAECIDLSELETKGYLARVPRDPSIATSNAEDFTNYYISKTDNGVIVVGACSEEAGSNTEQPVIEVSR